MDAPSESWDNPTMSIETIDDAPPTVRYHPATTPAPRVDLADYVVRILYREPGYAEKSGTHKQYSGRFIVRAGSLPSALAEAKARFHQIAAQSGVGWVRVIESIGGHLLEPGEPREGSWGGPDSVRFGRPPR